ncbi:MAG: hypothetical protein B7Z08_07795 [Sphingomonadales bacterium 32-68-7]|nr:MAG: hypothetical protein B7Z33_01890 [Sphingomonadales bacterium 12-68-11]OYX08866.1 MAG: hypothetical protein B7Z08_07795 [Sphingomonadales bacterium 32-68-7]
MKAPTIILAATLGAALLSAPALANDSLAIKTSDLDLETQAGQAQLERRVDRAARTACGLGEVRSGTNLPSQSARKCFEQAKANAMRQVNDRVAAAAAASPAG